MIRLRVWANVRPMEWFGHEAGAQDKFGVRFDKKTRVLSESVGTSPTTHILKPNTRQPRYAPSAINEFACMKLAKALKLPVPDVWLLRVNESAEPVYVIERYDRLAVAGNIVSLHQIDGCQLLGHGSGWKYQRSAGLVSLPKLVIALRALRVLEITARPQHATSPLCPFFPT